MVIQCSLTAVAWATFGVPYQLAHGTEIETLAISHPHTPRHSRPYIQSMSTLTRQLSFLPVLTGMGNSGDDNSWKLPGAYGVRCRPASYLQYGTVLVLFDILILPPCSQSIFLSPLSPIHTLSLFLSSSHLLYC